MRTFGIVIFVVASERIFYGVILFLGQQSGSLTKSTRQAREGHADFEEELTQPSVLGCQRNLPSDFLGPAAEVLGKFKLYE
jgi:hypothetical protein